MIRSGIPAPGQSRGVRIKRRAQLRQYKIWKNGRYRIYLTRTFIDRTKPPIDYQEVQCIHVTNYRSYYRTFFNTSINRYFIYGPVTQLAVEAFRAFVSQYNEDITKRMVLIRIVDGPNMEYRELGEWIYWELVRGDTTLGGSKSIKRLLKEYDRSLDEDDPGVVRRREKVGDLQREMNEDARKHFQLHRHTDTFSGGYTGRKMKKGTKVVFIGARTGKVLGVRTVGGKPNAS